MNQAEMEKYKATLEEIAALEKEHGMLGVSVLPEKGAEISPQEMADYVLGICKQTVEIREKRQAERIPRIE